MMTVAAGAFHSLAVTDLGVTGWGSNGSGRAEPPAWLGKAERVVAVAAGGMHSVALLDDGRVVAWGVNTNGCIDIPHFSLRVVGISAGGAHTAVLLEDGTVRSTARGADPLPLPHPKKRVVAVASGEHHTVGLLEDGRAVTWWGGKKTTLHSFRRKAVRVSAGLAHALVVLDNGTVVGWGDNSAGQVSPTGLRPTDVVVAVAAGGRHSLALLDSGAVVGWGYSLNARTAPPPNLPPNIVAIAAGGMHSLALDSHGVVHGWGYSGNQQAHPPPALVALTAPTLPPWIKRPFLPKAIKKPSLPFLPDPPARPRSGRPYPLKRIHPAKTRGVGDGLPSAGECVTAPPPLSTAFEKAPRQGSAFPLATLAEAWDGPTVPPRLPRLISSAAPSRLPQVDL
eukprot:Sspe_Gene.79591::Locus_49941_Transcript_1_1_Confidence_1.000_Length_1499::g.79591::m.79591